MRGGAAAGALAVAAVVGVAGCGGGSGHGKTPPEPGKRRGKPTPAHRTKVRRIGGAILPHGRGHLTAWVRHTVLLHSSPGGPVIARLHPDTEFKTPTVMPVVDDSGPWLGVVSSAAPNNRLSWVAARQVSLYRVPFSVQVSLHARRVIVRHNGIPVMRFTVAVGAPATPTPVGRYAVTDKLLTNAPGGPYGCCILALSGHQPHLREGWQGGNRIAIHGTDEPGSIGFAASNGCLRAPADAVARAVRLVPIGTIVRIRE